MPRWVPIEDVKAVAEVVPGAERLATEATNAAINLLRVKPPSVEAGVTADKMITAAVRRGDLPSGIYYRPENFAGLQNPRMVTVEHKFNSNNTLSLRGEDDNGFRRSAVYWNGNRVGLFDSKGGYERNEFPLRFPSVNLRLSDGREIVIPDRKVQVIEKWNQVGDKFLPDKKLIAVPHAEISPHTLISFNTASELRPGAQLIDSFPFQEVNGRLTDGKFTLALNRGKDQRWVEQNPQFARLPEENYQELIRTLKGQHLDEVSLPEWASIKDGRAFRFSKEALLNQRGWFSPNEIQIPVAVSRSDFTKQLDAAKIPAVLREHGGETVTVESVTLSQHNASLKLDPPDGQWLDHGVYLNGKRVGGYQNQYDGISRNAFPKVINTVEIKLSDGRVQTISDHGLHVVKGWAEARGYSEVYHKPNLEQLFTTSPIQISPWKHVDFAQAQQLRPGDTFIKRFPFLWDGDTLTNGMYSLPRVRPQRQEWRRWPIAAVKEGYWEPYTGSLEGKYVDDLVKAHPQTLKLAREIVDGPPKEIVKRLLTEDEEQVRDVITKAMWKGVVSKTGEKADYIDLGPAIVFKLPVAEGKVMHIVENPGDGAIYLFDNEEHARQLASGYMGRMYARDLGAPFVIHTGNWEDKLADAIEAFKTKMLAKAA